MTSQRNSHDNSQLTLHPQRTVITIRHTTHIRTAERRFTRTLLKIHAVQPILLARVVPTQERSALRTRHHCATLVVRRGTRAVFALHLVVQTLGVRLAVATHDRARAVAAHDLAPLTTHHGTQLCVARTTAVTAQETLAARTARRRRAERAVFSTLARRTTERRVRGTLDERWTVSCGRAADVAGTEHGQRHGAHGQERAERKVRHAAAVGTGELEWREMERGTVLEGQRTE